MEGNILKFGGAAALFLCIVGFGILPIKWRQFRTNKTLLSMSNCFSGGVFFAIGLIHILPEAGDMLERRKKDVPTEEAEVFPWSYFICLSCFSFILLIDKVIFNNTDEAGDQPLDLRKSMLKRSKDAEEDPEENFKEMVSARYKLALRLSQLEHPAASSKHTAGPIKRTDTGHSHDHDHENGHGHDHSQEKDEPTTQTEGKLNEKLLSPNAPVERLHNFFPKKEQKPQEHDHAHEEAGHGHDHGNGGHQHATVKKGDSYLTAYILLLAMGIHGIFAGLAFGVSKSDKEILSMFIAMIAHKWSEALTVGISFVTAELPEKRSVILIVFLASLTPIGIISGWLLSKTNDTVTGICMALSSGTFLYVSCAEIIVEEFSISKQKFWKFLAYVVGICFVISLSFLE